MTHDVPLPEPAPDAAPAKETEFGSQSYQTETERSNRMQLSRRDRLLRELGLNVSRWRKANRMTVAGLAESAGVAEHVVEDVEAGTGTPSLGDAMAVLMAAGMADTVVRAANPYNSLSGTVRVEALLHEGGWPEPTPKNDGSPEDLFVQLVDQHRGRSPLAPDMWRSPGIVGRSTRHLNEPRNSEDLAPADPREVRDARQRMTEFLERQDELLHPAYAGSMIKGEIFLRKIQAEFGFLSSADITDLLSEANTTDIAALRKAGDLLALKRVNRWVYPGFQIKDGVVRPVMAQR